jgi:hypothetical protein
MKDEITTGDGSMNILIVNGGRNLTLNRPYLNKFNDRKSVENSIPVGDRDKISFTENESDALEMLKAHRFDSLIISTGGEVDGCYLLDRIRLSKRFQAMPVTII